MKYTDVYAMMGDFGVYQVCMIIAMALMYMYCIDAITMVFVSADMPHWCRIDQLSHLPFERQKSIGIPYKEWTTPGQGQGIEEQSEYSSCQMFALNYSEYSDDELYNWNRTLMINESTPVMECTQWVYDQTIFVSTIVSRFDLVCNRDFNDEIVFTIFSLGTIMGAFVGGYLSDKFGRKISLIVFVVVHGAGVAITCAAPNYPLLLVGRLILGLGMAANRIVAYVYVMEAVGSSYRIVASAVLGFCLSCNFMLQSLLAWCVRSDVEYQLVAMAPSAVFLIYALYIPESLRWLLVNGKYEQAQQALDYICDANNTPRPASFKAEDFDNEVKTQGGQNVNVTSLFRSPRLRTRTLVVVYAWFTCSLLYYSLSLNVRSLPGDIFVNNLVSGAVEIPAYAIALRLLSWPVVGRRGTISGALVMAGLSSFICIPMIILGEDIGLTSMSMVGKAFSSVSFCAIYIIASEVFPTEARNIGMGLGSTLGGVGSMISPYIGPPLATVWSPLPSLVSGVVATSAGLLCLLLPETLNRPLADTIQQAEDMRRNDDTCSMTTVSNGDATHSTANGKTAFDETTIYAVTVPDKPEVYSRDEEHSQL